MDPLRRLTRTVGQQLGEGPGPGRRARQRHAVARLTRNPPRRGAGRWRWAIPAVAAALLLLTWVSSKQRGSDAPAIARTAAPPLMAGAWLVAESRPLALVFADRSRVTLAPGARARLAQVDPSQVRIDLERGRLELEAVAGRTWQVAAGRFTVAAADAGAVVEWAPQTHALVVEVGRGSARVHERGATDDAHVRAGQRSAFGQAIAPAPVTPLRTPEPRPSRPQPRDADAWSTLAQAGRHAEALAEAERHGYAGLLERLGVEDLERLAHSARLARAAAPAREALLALRRRFPRDGRAGTAAFLLARIAVDLERDLPAAIAWLDRYLAEHPDGPLAEEARGRLLRALLDTGERTRARAAATDYLRHHPDGKHAALATTTLAP